MGRRRPYIRANHQVHHFVRFCEPVLKQSLLELDVELKVQVNQNLHDREIRVDNGWIIKIGRGLDFYQKPDLWYGVGTHDLSMRPCLETKVDIYRQEG